MTGPRASLRWEADSISSKHPTPDASHDAKSLDTMRKEHIQRALNRAGNDLQKSAELLEISVRQLRFWMKRLEIQ